METKLKQTTYWLSVAIIGTILGLSLQLVRAAWTPAPADPPNANVGAPITTGSEDQAKGGGFISSGSISAVGAVRGTLLCIGGDCRNAWPTAVNAIDATGKYTLSSNLNINGKAISGVATPTTSDQAATKGYVDARPGDNMGDQIARRDITMGGNSINGANNITATGTTTLSNLCLGGTCKNAWPTASTSKFGGFYVHDSRCGNSWDPPRCQTANPQTGACSCPAGFNLVKILTPYNCGTDSPDGIITTGFCQN